ncbi:MAG: S8 family serine peptidase [Chitinophagales bacterium]|nr:S8 family serine peptidase [Chitinophagales bacterium]
MKSNLLFVFFVLLATTTFAQTTNYNIRLYNQTFLPEANLAQFDDNQSNFTDPQFLLLQFFQIPTSQERKKLEELGITLGDYIPNHAYVARVEKKLNTQALATYGVRSILALDERFKLSPELFEKRYPAEALNGENIRLVVTYYSGLDHNIVAEQLTSIGRIFSDVKEGTWIYLELPLSKLEELIQLSTVKYIEPSIPAIDEVPYWLSNGRTNWLNSNVNGLDYDGDGFTIAVKEGNEVDPTELVEFKGRFTEFVTTGNVSGHKTGVARRMASAGNKIPANRSIASGADLISQSNNSNYEANYTAINLRSVNHSYGFGVGTGGWSAGTTWDGQVRNGTGPTHTWSAGNNGGATSTYGPYDGIITGYANLTGGSKQAKNTFTVGSVRNDDTKAGFSSVGPTYDGRVKPDLTVEGSGGTSHAAPKISGIVAQMMEAYTAVVGSEPTIPVLKTLLLNTCDDLENIGPDYRTGYGRVNVRRAYKAIEENRFMEGTLNNGQSNSHQIQVPANVKELKVLIHWADYPAASSIPATALVNNLDLSVTDPGNTTTLPWILDPTANLTNLSAPATRGVDNLNNVEQVSITDPAAGMYTVSVAGTSIPQGPQTYYLTYEFLYDELTLTYPIGGEHLVPGESDFIYWDSYGGTGTFDLEYSIDNGSSWMPITSGIDAAQRYYEWTIPSHTSGEVLVRVKRGSLTSTSIEPLNIMNVPTGLQFFWSCSQSVLLSWDALPEATAYRVTRLGTKYMEEVAVTTELFYIVSGLSTTESEWFSVEAIGEDNAVSRRAEAIEVLAGDQNCINHDLAISSRITESFLADCLIPNGVEVIAHVQNVGFIDMSNFQISYQANGGSTITETYTGTLTAGQSITHTFSTLFVPTGGLDAITISVNDASDENNTNDSYIAYVQSYASGTVSPPYSQNFDGFTTCSTSSDCDLACTLEENWFNVGNLVTSIGDDMDWRTDPNGTPTGNTGPSGDHTSGTGNYLYLESSSADGNGCRNSSASMHSPCIDLCRYNQAALSFWYHMYGNSIGNLHLDVYSNGIWIEDVMTPIIGEQGDQWLEATVDLSAFAGQVIVLRFRGSTGNGFRADMAIDDISITGTTITPSITHPSVAPLSLGENCTLILPDYTTSANVISVLDQPTITQSPAPGSIISTTGNQHVELQLEDACGLTVTHIFYLNVIDDTDPTLDCPDNQTVNLNADCEALLPDLTALATASDNCDGVSMAQVPEDGILIEGANTVMVTITATDASGNTASCQTNVSAVDNTPPTANCQASIDLEIPEGGSVSISTDDINNGSSDNCGIASMMLDQTTFNCSDLGSPIVTLTVTDQNNQSSSCNTTINITDPNSYCCALTNAICNDATVYLDINGIASILPSDVGGGSIVECGLQSESISPMNFDCDDIGSPVSVTYTVTDINGATSSCMATVTVALGDQLPNGWQANDIGIVTTGNDYSFDPCIGPNPGDGEFTVIGSGNNTTSTNTDNVAFAHQSLCGNDITITAKVESLTPNGYGGLMIRETGDADSKQVAIFSNLSNSLRHETRYLAGANKVVQNFIKPSPVWLRLQRQGNWVYAFYSTNGTFFQYVHAVYIPLNDCIEIGLASFTYLPNTQTEATFSNVEIVGGVMMPYVATPEITESAAVKQTTSIYPNPTSDVVNLVFENGLNENATVILRNQIGQVIEQRELSAGEYTTEWNVNTLVDGLYYFEIRMDGEAIQVLRLVKTR